MLIFDNFLKNCYKVYNEVNMKGKIIVITGIDGTGKETQTKMLFEHLQAKGVKVKMQSFPNYESPSSAPVKAYLQGKIENAKTLSPMQVSSFFLIDFLQTMLNYQSFLNDGGVLLLDRYTESNLIHQAGRLKEPTSQIRFANMLKNLQYNALGLPKPDLVICLTMPLETSMDLMQSRTVQKNGGEKDIHEQDSTHLQTAHRMCTKFAELEKWTTINCVDENGKLRERTRIHNNIKNIVDKFLDFGLEKQI